jgi:hypothetical protein
MTSLEANVQGQEQPLAPALPLSFAETAERLKQQAHIAEQATRPKRTCKPGKPKSQANQEKTYARQFR